MSTEQHLGEKLIFRSIRIWFYTMLSGFSGCVFLLIYQSQPGKGGESIIFLPILFLFSLLLSIPVLFMTVMAVFLSSLARKPMVKMGVLLLTTLLINLAVYKVITDLRILSDWEKLPVLLPYSLFSLLFMFMQNRDWFRPQSINI